MVQEFQTAVLEQLLNYSIGHFRPAFAAAVFGADVPGVAAAMKASHTKDP